MGEWRRSSSWRSSRAHNRPPEHSRPPTHPGSWVENVPWWERKFLASISPIPLHQLSFADRSMSMFPNVQEWDDSGAVEALQDAKARFWAKFNGLAYDIPLPDPDMYIDEVDHDAVLDPELVAELEKEPTIVVRDNEDDGWDSILWRNEPIVPTGWGDAEDPVPACDPTAKPQLSSWDIHLEKLKPRRVDAVYPFPSCNTAEPQYSGCNLNNSCNVWNGGNANKWQHNRGWGDEFVQDDRWVNKKSWGPQESKGYESGRRHNRKRERGRGYVSRHMNQWFQMDNQQANNKWRNCRGRNNRIQPRELSQQTVDTRQPTTAVIAPNY